MKKLILFYSLTLLVVTPVVTARDGGAVGVQFGDVTFGLGGSSEGPILGIGHSPDNGRSFSPIIVPGGHDCGKCNNHKHRRNHKKHCSQCHYCDQCGYHNDRHHHHHHDNAVVEEEIIVFE